MAEIQHDCKARSMIVNPEDELSLFCQEWSRYETDVPSPGFVCIIHPSPHAER